jgi:hypothetical protein
MKAGESVKAAAAGWQVPHVRPLPSNLSWKKRRSPSSTSEGERTGVGVEVGVPVDVSVGDGVSMTTGSDVELAESPHPAVQASTTTPTLTNPARAVCIPMAAPPFVRSR